ESIAEWAAKITDTAVELFGELPVKDKYTFISVGSDQGAGGLEHRDGSVLMMPVTTFQELDRLTTYQSLVAHEYLHLWNVKRLVPVALINPDLTTPAHTESLWVAEGWTAFYDEVLPVRAGVWTAPAYLAMAATQAHSVLQRPGAQLQSVRRASHEAWVKQYIRDENTPNVGVNYYGHGAVLAWCIDLLIREAAPGGAGLDDAFRLLWQRFGRTGRGYTERDVQDAVNEAAGTNLDAFFDEYVEAPSLPPIKALVDVVGLRFAPATENLVPHLGAVVADENGLVRLTNVLRGGPAWEAGLSGGDLLLSLNGQRVGVGRLDVHLFALTPGEPVDVAVFRGSRMLHHTVHLGTHQAPDRLVRVPAPDDRQRAAYRSWLGANLDDISAV
ncbi:MAG: putative metalloprotease with PDZ domain, partial [Glaciecola sp.]